MRPDADDRPDDLPDQGPAAGHSASPSAATDPLEQTLAENSAPAGGQGTEVGAADVPTNLGRFKINGVLGQGGFGTVYLGFDDQLKRSVAIKVPTRVLSGVDLDKFLEEARRLAQLRHPGIVTVFDVGEFDGRCYIVSDYLSGLSLSDWMKSKPVGWRDAALITARLADALAHAHVHGTVHRDVKPSNVMMLADDQPVLIDFGLAVSDADGARESPGMVSGTVGYMSPEQTVGKAHRIDGRTDIYALGVMLYQLLSGKRPFASSDKLELLRQIREDEPQPLRQIVPDIPPELEQVCLKAMSKRMHDRYTSAADLADALRSILQKAGDAGQLASQPAEMPEMQESDSVSRSASHMHEAERRQITTLHLDIDDSSIDVDDLDPEELRSVVQRVRELTARILTRFGGHFAHSSSEAIQVYFGYPQALEDAARRAVFAGLEISTEIKNLQERLQRASDPMIEFRIGIHTGIVVTEEVEAEFSSERHSIVGNVPRIAAGLATLGEPGAVIVSGTTRQIVGDAVAYESLGTHSSRAIGRNVEVFAVAGPLESEPDRSGEAADGAAPLIGREHEMGLLNQCWQQAATGSGQLVSICAEAGVGKSRLLSAFRQGLAEQTLESFQVRCSTFHQNSAFYPISEFLSRLAQLRSEDSDEAKLGKLESMLNHYGIPLQPVVPLFVDLLSIPLGPRYSVVEGTPERRKQKTIEALVELMFAASESQPLLLTIEDLHWVDPTTLEFLSVLIDQIASVPMLLVVTYRPEFTSPWPVRPGLTQLTIGNLTPQQTSNVVARIVGPRPLPPEVVDHIVVKTGGVPLFTEELTKVILESDFLEESGDQYVLARPLASLSIPSTLHDSLMARLDKLGDAKEVAQLAAVIGREFTFELLAAIAPLDEQTLQARLTALTGSELVHQRGFFPRARFTFKHALVQDTAYASLLRTTRGQWHGRIADVLASSFPRIAETDPALLAHHYTEAGQTIQAIGYWEKAGLQAQERSAHHEAINHFRQGLVLVESLEPCQQRDGLEFKFQIPLGVALLTTKGYAAPEVGPVFERARQLGQKLAGPAEQFFIHWGIWAWRVVREELQLCNQMADEAQKIVEPIGDPGLQMEAWFIPALTSFYLGDLESSLRCCQQGFALYDEQTAKLYARHTGQNVGVTMQCYWALSLWHLGYPDQAIARIQQAVETARSVNHPFSLAYALCHAGWFYHNCRISSEVRRAADQGVAISHEQGFPFWLAESSLHQGFSLLLEQKTEDGLQSLQFGLDVFNMTGAKLSLCHFHAMFAAAHLHAGNTDEARRRIDEAEQASKLNGNKFFLAEIHRLRGEILLAAGRSDDVEACFQESLQVARSQQAKSWELRTTISLTRLWQTQDRGSEAQGALAEVYSWFTEGFETPDLVDAKRLLDSLS